MRQHALDRKRRIILNDDGCDFSDIDPKIPATREGLYALVLDHLKGSDVDTVSFCPGCVGQTLMLRSMTTETFNGTQTPPHLRHVMPELLAQGTDCLQMAVEFCRANKLEIFASFRVNDVHDSWYPGLFSDSKRENASQLVGTEQHRPPFGEWTSYDFARPEVRSRVRAIIRELMTKYDIDGVEMDFYRFPVFFKTVSWGGEATPDDVAAMTQLMRDIRADADEIGRKYGKYLIVSASNARDRQRQPADAETPIRRHLHIRGQARAAAHWRQPLRLRSGLRPA